ncbi:MAG: hypothetical protein HZC37_06850 [Burkholderiales bacterium]|nr:hypothetical protein [Burkholderiales bacterium]
MKQRTASTRRLLMAVLAATLVVVAPAAALAQAKPRVIGVMSLIADEFVVVGQEGTTGTKLDQNVRERVPIEGGAIERVVLGTAMKAVASADAAAKVMPMLVNEPRYYRGQSDWIDGDQATLPTDLAEALRGAGMTHLILVQKLRADARMNTGRGSLGSGRLEGVGFYVDRITRLRLEGTSELTVGYLAPYLYARVLLVDLAGMRVLAKREVTRGEVVIASQTGARGGDPWDWLDAKGKLQAIASMIERDLGDAVAVLAKGP